MAFVEWRETCASVFVCRDGVAVIWNSVCGGKPCSMLHVARWSADLALVDRYT